MNLCFAVDLREGVGRYDYNQLAGGRIHPYHNPVSSARGSNPGGGRPLQDAPDGDRAAAQKLRFPPVQLHG